MSLYAYFHIYSYTQFIHMTSLCLWINLKSKAALYKALWHMCGTVTSWKMVLLGGEAQAQSVRFSWRQRPPPSPGPAEKRSWSQSAEGSVWTPRVEIFVKPLLFSCWVESHFWTLTSVLYGTGWNINKPTQNWAQVWTTSDWSCRLRVLVSRVP